LLVTFQFNNPVIILFIFKDVNQLLMIKFFRKIRQNLLNKNKVGKYLLYAIGETILVVVGILIALNINNKNEERKAAENTMLLFKKLHKELELNIKTTNNIINIYRNKDSIAYKIINKKVSKEEFRLNPQKYLNLLITGRGTNISDEAFQNLINEKGNTSQTQDSLILKLKSLYGVNKHEIDMMDAKIGEYIFWVIEKQKNEQDWYYQYYNFRTVTNEMLDYFLLDPTYINEVTYYKTAWLGEHSKDNIEFRNKAIERYSELSDYLNIPIDSSITKNVKNFEHYIGTYKSNQSEIIYQIIKRNNQLIWTWKNGASDNPFGEINFYPDSKTYFTIGNSFGKLLYNDNSEVTGFIRSNVISRQEFKKIKY